MQIDYDPSRISYGELLRIFWESHDPTQQSGSSQYRHTLFYHNEEQRRQAEASRDALAPERGARIVTGIVPYGGFYLAEDYHQKHTLRSNRDILAEFNEMYPGGEGLISSTAAARVNGYLSGSGTCNALRAEIEGLGLSPEGQRKLLLSVCGR